MLSRAMSPPRPLDVTKPGVAFAKARLLRLGIILYGVKLTVQQIAGIGAAGLLTDLFTLATCFPLGILLGRALKIDAPLAALITTGASICGCSAVAAAAPVVDGEAHEVAAAVGTVVLCGTSASASSAPRLHACAPRLCCRACTLARSHAQVAE